MKDSLLWECVCCQTFQGPGDKWLHRVWFRNSYGGVIEVVTDAYVPHGHKMQMELED